MRISKDKKVMYMKVLLEKVRSEVEITPDGRLTRKSAASYLGVSPRTLADRHRKGLEPRSVKVGSRRFYYLQDLDDFIRGERS